MASFAPLFAIIDEKKLQDYSQFFKNSLAAQQLDRLPDILRSNAKKAWNNPNSCSSLNLYATVKHLVSRILLHFA